MNRSAAKLVVFVQPGLVGLAPRKHLSRPVRPVARRRFREYGTLLSLLFAFGRSGRGFSRSGRSFSRSSRGFSRSGRGFGRGSSRRFSRGGRSGFVHRGGRGRRGRRSRRGGSRSFAAANQSTSQRRRHNQRPNLLHQRSPQGAGSGRTDRTTGAILRFGVACKDGLTT